MRQDGRNAPPLVLSVFSTLEVGGPQVRFAQLANHYGPRFRHAVVAMDGRMDAAALLSGDLDVRYPEIGFRKGSTLSNVRLFRRFLRAERPDVLVTANFGAIEWALANLLPLVRHVHLEDGFGPDEQDGQIRRRVLIRRAALRRATVVLPSKVLWAVAAEVWRLPKRNLRLIPNGIDLARFERRHGRAEPPEGAEAPLVVGTVAGLRGEKNLGRLVEAFCRLRHGAAVELHVAGDGPERGSLEALASRLGGVGRVRFLGHVADPSRLYAGFDVFAMSSDTEQMPISLLEAMAAGLPVAATDVGDVRDMVAEENQAFVGPRSVDSLADAIGRLLADRGLRERLGRANRRKAERSYGQQGMFDAYQALLLPEPARGGRR